MYRLNYLLRQLSGEVGIELKSKFESCVSNSLTMGFLSFLFTENIA